MLRNLLLLIFGIVTLIAILNCMGVIHWLDSSPSTGPTITNNSKISDAYNDSLRYDAATDTAGGGRQVVKDTVIRFMNNFQATCSDADSTHCVFFSKRALDKIFADDLTANGIICCFGRANGGHLQMAITGMRLKYNLLETIDDPPIYFAAQAWCPPNCPYPK